MNKYAMVYVYLVDCIIVREIEQVALAGLPHQQNEVLGVARIRQNHRDKLGN